MNQSDCMSYHGDEYHAPSLDCSNPEQSPVERKVPTAGYDSVAVKELPITLQQPRLTAATLAAFRTYWASANVDY